MPLTSEPTCFHHDCSCDNEPDPEKVSIRHTCGCVSVPVELDDNRGFLYEFSFVCCEEGHAVRYAEIQEEFWQDTLKQEEKQRAELNKTNEELTNPLARRVIAPLHRILAHAMDAVRVAKVVSERHADLVRTKLPSSWQ